jgi:hypothetical protein
MRTGVGAGQPEKAPNSAVLGPERSAAVGRTVPSSVPPSVTVNVLLAADQAREQHAGPGIPPSRRWRPISTFFQTLIDMKNARVPGAYRVWAHDYRADLPRFISEVFRLPVMPQRPARVEEALVQRELVREHLFSAGGRDTPR